MSRAIFVLWAPVRDGWDEIQGMLAPRFEVLSVRDIHIAGVAFHSLLLDLYTRKPIALHPEHRERSYFGVLAEKFRMLSEHAPVLRVIEARHTGDGDSGQATESVKAEIRKRFPVAHGFRGKLNLNLHASDSQEEADYLADVLLSKTNIAHIRQRSRLPRPGFCDMLHGLREWCGQEGIDTRDVCVVSGGVLEACEIREASDLDIIMLERGRFGNDGFKGNGIDVAAAGWHPSYTDVDVIQWDDLHFNFLGMKFAALPLVADVKLSAGRTKDKGDRALLTHPDVADKVASLR